MESEHDNNIDSKPLLEEIAIAVTILAIVIATGNFLSLLLFREDIELVLSAISRFQNPPLLSQATVSVSLTFSGILFQMIFSFLLWVISTAIFIGLTHILVRNVLSGEGTLQGFIKRILWLNTGIAIAVLVIGMFFETMLLQEFANCLENGVYVGRALQSYQSGQAGYYLIDIFIFLGWSVAYSYFVKSYYQFNQTKGCVTTLGAFIGFICVALGIIVVLALFLRAF